MLRLSLRERLAAATGSVQNDCTTSVAVTPYVEGVEPSSRTLTEAENSEVTELFGSEYPEVASVDNITVSDSDNACVSIGSGSSGHSVDASNTVVISEEELATIREMMETYNQEEVSEESDEDEEDDEAPQPIQEPEPIPEPEPEPEAPVPTRRRTRRNRTFEEVTSRFSGASWFESIREKSVTIVGCGGIGSWTALLLSRLGIDGITVFDDDTVETGNMSGQFYSSEDVGSFKVDALYRKLIEYSAFHNITTIPAKFTSESSPSCIMISCLDSMRARKEVFDTWHSFVNGIANKDKCLFIDGRLSAETLQVFAVAGDSDIDIERYRESLFDDEEADSEVCSYKQTTFMANMIASIITNIFVNFVASKLPGGAVREIPFKTEYMGENMWLKTEM